MTQMHNSNVIDSKSSIQCCLYLPAHAQGAAASPKANFAKVTFAEAMACWHKFLRYAVLLKTDRLVPLEFVEVQTQATLLVAVGLIGVYMSRWTAQICAGCQAKLCTFCPG